MLEKSCIICVINVQQATFTTGKQRCLKKIKKKLKNVRHAIAHKISTYVVCCNSFKKLSCYNIVQFYSRVTVKLELVNGTTFSSKINAEICLP